MMTGRKTEEALNRAYNEFVSEFCDRHEKCQATRDEAHEKADKLVEFGKSLFWIAKESGLQGQLEYMIEAIDFDEPEAAALVSWAAANA